MYLTGIEASNCYSFDNIQLSLDEAPITQVVGKNLDEKRVVIEDSGDFNPAANGVGKTNLYNLIIQALYSRDINKTKKSYLSNLYTKKNFEINLYLILDDLPYRVKYTSKECELYKDGKLYLEGRKSVTDFFESIIPFELFLKLTYLSNSVYFRFFDAANKEVQNLLTLIFSDLLQLKNKLPKLKEEKQRLEKELVEVNKAFAHFTIQSQQQEQDLIPVPDEYTGEDYSDQLTSLGMQYGNISREIEEYENLEKNLNKLKIKPVNYSSLAHEASRSECAKLKATLDKINKEIQKYSKIKGKTECPTCGNQLNAAEISTLLQNLENKKTDLLLKVNKAQQELAAFEQQEQRDKENKLIENKINYLKKEKEKKDITELKQNLKKINDSISRLNELQREENKKRVKSQKERTKVKEENARRELIKSQIKRANRELIEINKQISKLNSDIKIINILEEVCNKTVVAKQIPNRLKILETFINTELAQYTSQYSVTLKMHKDKIVREVIKEGKTYPVENLSSGEKTRLNIALLFAIRNILKALRKDDINIIFFDECFSSLDISGRNILLNSEAGYNKFVISHTYISNEFPIIELVRKNNKTTISQ